MARIMRMPDEDELPPGPRRDFVEFLFELFKRARRPTLRQISRVISDGDYAATASTETIRKMLRGASIPPTWETVEVVMLALCDLGNVDPNDEWEYMGEEGTPRSHLERYWNRALDQPNLVYRRARQFADPWDADRDGAPF